jgi:hypothetical protein
VTNIKSIILLTFSLSAILACESGINKAKSELAENEKNPAVYSRKPIDSLTQDEIWTRYLTNPCYLPLLKDPEFWEKGTPVGFSFAELLNDSLSADNMYRTRYLVGDFNAVGPDKKLRGANEVYPKLSDLPEFKKLPSSLVNKMDKTYPGTAAFEQLKIEIENTLGDSAFTYINFLNKVWAYKMVPIIRQYSIENNNLYSAGQTIAMCEACTDTLKLQGRFATSAKRQDIGYKVGANGSKRQFYVEYFPIGNRRKYYAGLYRITSKNWETKRKYDSLDIARDKELGGGNNRVTFFKGSAELPNFLLLQPDARYPKAMRQNGIHEVALRGLSRGMLGTANSIGCLRVSDFGSKFLRWWVPQNCKIFVGYKDSLYHNKVTEKSSAEAFLPFKNAEEGNAFRKWLNTYKPNEAKILEISETGDYRNGHIIDGYYYFKDEYNKYVSSKKN